jgi:predicted Co/Zn/Cd cation transporter (cation efflux family)
VGLYPAPALYAHGSLFVVAVSVFNAALTLELTRRENDQKIIALNMKMCDMMSVLSLYVFVLRIPG